MAGGKKERRVNPVLKQKKNEKNKRLKKLKQTRQMQQEMQIRQKDPHEIIFELQKLNDLETESIRKGYFNEKTIREKRHKCKESLQQMISYYEKNDKVKAKEIRGLLNAYDNKESDYGSKERTEPELTESEKKLQNAKELIKRMLPYIPLPTQNATPEVENRTIEQKESKSFPTIPWLPVNLKPAGPPPLPPHEESVELPEHLKNQSMHSTLASMFNTSSNQIPKTVQIASVSTGTTNDFIDANKNYTSESTVMANPILRDLQAQVTKMVPTSIIVKKSSAITQNKSEPPPPPVLSKQSAGDKLLKDFMNEINELS